MGDLKINRILAATDLSQPALIALRYARFFAERFAAGLTVMYVDPIIFPVNGIGVEMSPYLAARPEHFAALEKEIRTYAAEALSGLRFEVAAVGGRPVPMIVRESHERAADLVVLATHGLRGWRRAILGSVTEGVLHFGDCPVLSVSRPEEPLTAMPRMTKILCPINFTEVARDALEYAAFLSGTLGCELAVVHIREEDGAPQAAERDLASWMGTAIRERCTIREIVLRGGPAERVLDCAEDIGADLLVIGAQHKTFRDTATIGTTTERLVRFARVPVLSVPRPVEAKESGSGRTSHQPADIGHC